MSIGNDVILHAAVCIGADGFGYVRSRMGYHKFPQVGTVVIEDEVELGAHTCVDRAALGRTRIGRGTKLDNMVHVGHNCDIGERVVIAAQTGISGSVVIEDEAVIGGQVGFGDHTRVQKGAIIGSKAGILPGKIVRPGVVGNSSATTGRIQTLECASGSSTENARRTQQLRARIVELEKLNKGCLQQRLYYLPNSSKIALAAFCEAPASPSRPLIERVRFAWFDFVLAQAGSITPVPKLHHSDRLH